MKLVPIVFIVVYREMKIGGCYHRKSGGRISLVAVSETEDAPEDSAYENIVVNGQRNSYRNVDM
jgi:hypothetical protein